MWVEGGKKIRNCECRWILHDEDRRLPPGTSICTCRLALKSLGPLAPMPRSPPPRATASMGDRQRVRLPSILGRQTFVESPKHHGRVFLPAVRESVGVGSQIYAGQDTN